MILKSNIIQGFSAFFYLQRSLVTILYTLSFKTTYNTSLKIVLHYPSTCLKSVITIVLHGSTIIRVKTFNHRKEVRATRRG